MVVLPITTLNNASGNFFTEKWPEEDVNKYFIIKH
jgi:hypothetical protein